MDIRKKLIHLLGGVTPVESQESDGNSWTMGRASMCIYLKEKMEEMHGLPADEWSRQVWLLVMHELAITTGDNKLLAKVRNGDV